MTFALSDFPLQSVLIEPSADIDQESGRTAVNGTAENHVAHALGGVDAKPQDHTHQQSFGKVEKEKTASEIRTGSTGFEVNYYLRRKLG